MQYVSAINNFLLTRILDLQFSIHTFDLKEKEEFSNKQFSNNNFENRFFFNLIR